MGLCGTGFEEGITVVKALCVGGIGWAKILERVGADTIDTRCIILHDLGPAGYLLNAETVIVLNS